MQNDSQHLAINLVQLLPEKSGGIETYARELLPRIIDQLPEWQITAYVNSEGFESYPEWDDRCDWQHVDMSWYDRRKRVLAESTVLPRRIRQSQATLVHNMVNTACRKPGCPQLTTVFDATPQLYPEPGESIPSKLFRRLLAAGVKRSDAIVTISKSAAIDIPTRLRSARRRHKSCVACRPRIPAAHEPRVAQPAIQSPD